MSYSAGELSLLLVVLILVCVCVSQAKEAFGPSPRVLDLAGLEYMVRRLRLLQIPYPFSMCARM